jgi:2-keto-3-deoxy-L-rhamnonate aldolase RhmA
MSTGKPAFTEFRARLKKREQMLGTFLKMPTTQTIELLGTVGYDFVVIDQEHAPLGRETTDMMILACRASNITPIVRVGDAADHNILSVLDCGAIGVMVPHVDSPEKARQIARACRYTGGSRGMGNVTRAGRWGSLGGMNAHKKNADNEVTCIAMIEDLEAVDHVGAIARVEGIDAIFIGRGDLTAVIGGEQQTDPKTTAVVEKITAQARDANIPIIILASNKDDALKMRSLGASTFIVGSDHGFFKSGATAGMKEIGLPLA